MQIRDEAIAAFELLPPELKRQIGPDAIPLLRTAMQLRTDTTDPLVDGTIDAALEQHGIKKDATPARYAAYRRMLVAHFNFGADTLARRAKRAGKQAGGRA